MRLFKRKPDRACHFCGAVGVRLTRVDGDRSEPIEEDYCAACGNRARELEGRLRYIERDGWAKWLAFDPGTERAVTVTVDPLAAVRAELEGLGTRLREVSPAAARIASLRHAVFANDPKGPEHGSLDEAIGDVAERIAQSIAREHGLQQKGEETGVPWPGTLCSFGLCGDGSGIVYQEVLPSDGTFLRQWCNLVDTDHVVHSYYSYHR